MRSGRLPKKGKLRREVVIKKGMAIQSFNNIANMDTYLCGRATGNHIRD